MPTDEPTFRPRAAVQNRKLEELATMTEEEFRVAFKSSPVKRAKWVGLKRNVGAALARWDDREADPPNCIDQ